jgi:hypothetical protein
VRIRLALVRAKIVGLQMDKVPAAAIALAKANAATDS